MPGDERLVRWSNLPLREVQGVFWMTQFCVWLGRRVLWVLMYAGHAVSCFMLRQMEFDADRCEARVAGSENRGDGRAVADFECRLAGSHGPYPALAADGHLADDICELLLANVRQIPAEASEALRTAIAAEKTRRFHTHPCDAEKRIARHGPKTPKECFASTGQRPCSSNVFRSSCARPARPLPRFAGGQLRISTLGTNGHGPVASKHRTPRSRDPRSLFRRCLERAVPLERHTGGQDRAL